MMAIIFSTIDNPSSSAGHADHYYYSGEILTGWTLCLLALSFLFNFSWDLLVDWHILHIQWIPKRFSYQISFKKPLFIPSMILAVFALFNFWVRLLPFSRYIQGPLYISGISLSTHLYVGLEILRRWIWTFLRLQSHLENTFNYFELDQAHSTSSNNTQICPENLPLDCDENISDIINS